MSIHEFTLRATLPSAESDPEQYVEALYEAGCDDAVLGIGRKGVISLVFSRDAKSRGAAIASAIADVRSVLESCEVEEDILSHESAEGKAIRRIANPIPEDEWEVVYKPGDKVDINEIRNRLAMRAYEECSQKYRNALRALAE